MDFTFLPVLQYGPETESIPRESFSALLDDFFSDRESAERVRQRGQDLVKSVTSARDRTARKLGNQAGSWRPQRTGSACGSWGTSSPPTST